MKVKVEDLKDLEISVNVSEEKTKKLYDAISSITTSLMFQENGIVRFYIDSIMIKEEIEDEEEGVDEDGIILILNGYLEIEDIGQLYCKIALPKVDGFI